MGEKGSVVQGPQARAVIGHGVRRSWDVGVLGEVSMCSLVQGLEAQKIGCRSRGGGRPFGLPAHGWGVVGQGCSGAFSHVHEVGDDVVMGDGAGQLEVRVGDGTRGIFPGDYLGLDFGGERESPEVGLRSGGVWYEDYSSHAGLGCVGGASNVG